MSDAAVDHAQDTVRYLADAIAAPASKLPAALSRLLMPFVAHRSLVILDADVDIGVDIGVDAETLADASVDADAGPCADSGSAGSGSAGSGPAGSGPAGSASQIVALDTEALRRSAIPGTVRRVSLNVAGQSIRTLQLSSRNGVLLVLTSPHPRPGGVTTVQRLWDIVAVSVRRLADTSPPDYLQVARVSSGERSVAVAELADEYSTTLESVLGALRAPDLSDRAARVAATSLAAGGLVKLRTAGDRVMTGAEEPVTTAFARLRDDLRPIVRYRDLEVEFVEPPADGRPLPSEVAHGARAVVRGVILALIERDEVARIRVQWDCDGANLLIDVRDDGAGLDDGGAAGFHLVRQRVHALGGRMQMNATPGWGAQLSIVIPLDPPRPVAGASVWGLRPREVDVLQRLVAGRRNRQIAADLSISENTVKFHLASIFRKLDVGSRTEAAALYLSQSGGAA